MSADAIFKGARSWATGMVEAWDRFWFTPRLPYTLGVMRIITGLMLLYSHLVLASDLSSFLGDHAWVNNETAKQLHDGTFGYSDLGRTYLWHLSNPLLLWLHHGVTLLVTLSFAAGFMTRITAPAAWFLQLMYLHRMLGHLFGLDQIVTYSTMYLMLAPCGSCFSVDAWLRKKWSDRLPTSRWLRWLLPDASPSVAANVATRLLQLHLCVIYMFGGLSKARGESWWDGTAMWYSVGNYEYQSIDMTWIINYPRVFTAMTHATLFWEIFYCALIWPRRTRPFTLAVAVAVHGGIALFLGMITFGTMMIAANMVFLRPEWIMKWLRIEAPESAASAAEEQRSDTAQSSPSPARELTAELNQRESELEEREERLRLASKRMRTKTEKMKAREQKYKDRVARLKEREAKIKRLVERKRKAKAARKDPK